MRGSCVAYWTLGGRSLVDGPADAIAMAQAYPLSETDLNVFEPQLPLVVIEPPVPRPICLRGNVRKICRTPSISDQGRRGSATCVLGTSSVLNFPRQFAKRLERNVVHLAMFALIHGIQVATLRASD